MVSSTLDTNREQVSIRNRMLVCYDLLWLLFKLELINK